VLKSFAKSVEVICKKCDSHLQEMYRSFCHFQEILSPVCRRGQKICIKVLQIRRHESNLHVVLMGFNFFDLE
jgi:hypothetical protein